MTHGAPSDEMAPVAEPTHDAPGPVAGRRRVLWRRQVDSEVASLDVPVVNLAARIRVALAVVAAAVGSFLPGLTRDESALFLILGLVWVPWATVVLLASARPNSRLALLGGPSGDLVVLFGVQLVLPDASELVLLGYLVVIAFAAATAGRRVAAVLASVAFAFTLIAQVAAPPSQRLGAVALVPFCAAVLAVLFLVDRRTTLQTRADARAQRYQSRADSVLAHVADAVVVTDEVGSIIECNPLACTWADRPHEQMLGSSCADALGLKVGQRDLDCSDGCAILALTAGATGHGIELWRTNASDMRQPLLANASVIANDIGGYDVVHSLRDITRLKQAEDAKTLFLATASHELKTPLTVIRGFADVLADYDSLSESTRQTALRAIATRANQLTEIVERMLLSSRIEAGTVTVETGPIEVGPSVVERASALAAATGRMIDVRVPRDLPLVVGNADALVTVVDHLLDNALKYSPDGGPLVVDVATNGWAVTVTVRDSGIGMDAEQAAHCFDKFWQAESTDVRRFGGTGIGLYIVQSLVEGMGGTVAVESQPGRGSSFSFTLRTTDAPAPAARRAPASEPGVGEETSIREFMRQIGIPGRPV
jgi:signal transduction histidine kinase